MKKLLILASLFSILISCKKVEKMPLDPHIIANEHILLDKKQYEHKDYKGIMLGFDKDILYGFTGINNFNAKFEIKDNRLVVDIIGITLAAGSKEEMKIEREILNALQYNTKFEITKDGIKLTDKLGKVHEFKRTKILK